MRDRACAIADAELLVDVVEVGLDRCGAMNRRSAICGPLTPSEASQERP
jgi:hypothetical protein